MKSRYEVAGIGQFRVLNTQPPANQETQVLQNFCKKSDLVISMKKLAEQGRDKEPNTSMLSSVENADSFLKALDILAANMDGMEGDIIASIAIPVLSFFNNKDAQFQRQIPCLYTNLKVLAQQKGFAIESEEAVYCKPKFI